MAWRGSRLRARAPTSRCQQRGGEQARARACARPRARSRSPCWSDAETIRLRFAFARDESTTAAQRPDAGHAEPESARRLEPRRELGYFTRPPERSRCHGVASFGTETARGLRRAVPWRAERPGTSHCLQEDVDHMRAGIVFAPARPARRMATCIAAIARSLSAPRWRWRSSRAAAAGAGAEGVADPASGAAGAEAADAAGQAAAAAGAPQIPGSPARPAGAGGRAAADRLFAVDQVLRQGQQHRSRQGSLPHREGGPARDRPVPRRRGADRAGGRGEEAVPHHAAARRCSCRRARACCSTRSSR